MKKTWKSIISMILVVVLISQLLPLSIFAAKAEETQATQNATDEEEVYVIGEVEELREAAVKHFRMSDGSYILVEYSEPIHFQNDDGSWEEIDNTLKKSGSEYVSENGPVRKAFSANLATGELFEISYEDKKLSMTLMEAVATSEPAKDEPITAKKLVETDIVDEFDSEVDTEEIASDAEVADKTTSTLETAPAAEDAALEASANAESALAEVEKAVVSADRVQFEAVEAKNVKANVENAVKEKISHKNSEPVTADDVAAMDFSVANVRYSNALKGTDITYKSESNGIKESIVINQKQDDYIYSFGLDLNGLTPVLQENGSILLNDVNNQTIFEIPTPWMKDANNQYSENVKYSIQESDSKWILTVTADAEWINAEDRAFPVIVDPTVQLQGSTTIQTIALAEGSSIYPGTSDALYCGYLNDTNFKNIIIYSQVVQLPYIPDNCVPIDARIGLAHAKYMNSNQVDIGQTAPHYNDFLTIEAHASSHSYSNVSSLTYLNLRLDDILANNYTETILDYMKLGRDELNHMVYWDITAEAVKWFTNGTANTGIIFRAPYGSTEQRCVGLVGSAYNNESLDQDVRPSFVVTYRNTVGIEDYYTYQEASAGRAGDIFISDFTNQLTAVHNNLNFNSEVTPFSVSHIYNSVLSAVPFTEGNGLHTTCFKNMQLGYGWKLSVQQTVTSAPIANQGDLIYTDGDGTEHYFHPTEDDPNTYKDEDGLDLTIKKSWENSVVVYTMTDKGEENTWIFYRGYLITQKDAVGNAIFIAYNNNFNNNESSTSWKPVSLVINNRIVQVVSVPNGKSASVICSFQYSGQDLTKITDYAGRTMTFTYANESFYKNDDEDEVRRVLKSIRHPDGTYARYEYDYKTGRLKTLFDDEAKFGIGITQRFVLGRWATNQVSEFTADSVTASRTVGNAFHAYRNSPQMTSYRFYGPDHASDTEDDTVTFYILDHFGRTVCAYNTDWKKQMIIGASSSMYADDSRVSNSSERDNRVSGATSLGHVPANLITDGGVETSSAWVVGSKPSTATATISTNKPRTGSHSIQLTNSSSSALSSVSMHQSFNVTGGKTYTFTGYINTSGLTNFSSTSGGVYLGFFNGTRLLAKSEVINYATSENDPNSGNYDLGWEKVTATFTPILSGPVYVAVVQSGVSGTSYCDDLQVGIDSVGTVTGSISASPSVNMLSSDSGSWSGSYYTWQDSETLIGDSSAIVTGEIAEKRRLTQTVQINKPASELTFALSGWAKAHSIASASTNPDYIPQNEGEVMNWRYFGLVATIHYAGSSATENHFISFNKDTDDWQFVSGIIVPKNQSDGAVVTTIDISCAYDYNANEARFNKVSLVQEPFPTYSYDDTENKEVASNGDAKLNVEYVENSNRLRSYTTASRNLFSMDYYDNHLLKTIRTAIQDGDIAYTQRMYYNDTGNVIEQRIAEETYSGSVEGQYIKTSNTYSNDGHFLTSSTDANGNTTTYAYNNSRQLSSVTKPDQVTRSITYMSGSDRIESTSIASTSALNYSYTEGNLSVLNRTSYSDAANGTGKFNQEYLIASDRFGNTHSISVRGSADDSDFSEPITLASYEYDDTVNNGLLKKMTYANGNTVSYEYDMFNRLTSETFNDETYGNGTNYHYQYDSFGNLAKQYANSALGVRLQTFTYQYDSLGRLIHSREKNSSGATVLTTSHVYDTSDRLTNQSWQLSNGDTYKQSYQYSNGSSGDGTLQSVKYATPQNGEVETTYSYNSLRQMTGKSTEIGGKNFTNDFVYLANSANSNQQTSEVGEVKYTYNANQILDCTYEYDNMGRITSAEIDSPNGNGDPQTYTYDNLGQLSGYKYNYGTYIYYSYDTAGNITESYYYTPAYLVKIPQVVYHYNNSAWGDLLTSFTTYSSLGLPSTHTITYPKDSNGNVIAGTPLTWYNGSNMSLTWGKGTRLTTVKKGTTNTTYTYDMSGVRSGKTVGNTTYTFTTLSGQVVRQTWGSSRLDFVYDESNRPFAMLYTANTSTSSAPVVYYYLLDLQGDVIGLMDESGSVVAYYEYDPWGATKVLDANGSSNSSSSFIGNINPLRYRGYYYDTETGFYYLESRYYDPVIGRFISSDSFATTDLTSFISANTFAYCENNPVCYKDENGTLANWAIGAAAGFLVGGLVSSIKGEGFMSGAVKGAVSGAVAGAAVDMALAVVATGGLGAVAVAGAISFVGGFVGNIAGEETWSLLDAKHFKSIDSGMAFDSLVSGIVNIGGFIFSGLLQLADKGIASFNQIKKLSVILKSGWNNIKQFSFNIFKIKKYLNYSDVASFFGALHYVFHGAIFTSR